MITVVAWPKLRKDRRYAARVKSVKLQKASNCLRVTLENLDPVQQGRIHGADLPVPVRPGNRTCRFLAACGIGSTEVGATIDLDQLVGRHIGFRPHGQEPDQFEFEQIPNPSTAKTALPTEDAQMERSGGIGTSVDRGNDPSGY